jgi:hypothetical protein
MTINTNFNTPEAQAIREQFRQQVETQRLALKNAPKLLSAKPKKVKKS